VIANVSGTVELSVSGASVHTFFARLRSDTAVTAWLLANDNREVLPYAKALAAIGGLRRQPFGFRAIPVPVDLSQLDSTYRALFKQVVLEINADLAPMLGREYFQIVDSLPDHGLRAVSTDARSGPGRPFYEGFDDDGNGTVCRVEVLTTVPANEGFSTSMAHDIGHCLGLARHDPHDSPDRVMNREAPPDYWRGENGLNEFDARVFALAAVAAAEEIDLTRLR
jgi:hypothetical protein